MAERQYKYKVTGRGDFPWDMLRYDRAYPITDPTPNRYENEEAWQKIRTVELVGQGCTPDRWSSFLWSVVDADIAMRGVRV